ncbi:hypothetical protein POM88_038855 [Heracleum sosnowskyi]|uniref:ABC1 atypical kinase-like domain-containing protein n=1 Tax=Heracleum sosnowskyi TaxID=360622 RepID=A0AAD8HA59_9APIA|nr:hypothetical protein POM88_038855 [Heracleum sosnowskyi]
MWERQHELAAEKIYSMCSDLGWFFLKVAQIIGKPDLAPAAWVKRLVTLCDQALPTPANVVRGVLEAALGQSMEEVFEMFDLDALGSAWIAQKNKMEHDATVQIKMSAEEVDSSYLFCDDANEIHVSVPPPLLHDDDATVQIKTRSLLCWNVLCWNETRELCINAFSDIMFKQDHLEDAEEEPDDDDDAWSEPDYPEEESSSSSSASSVSDSSYSGDANFYDPDVDDPESSSSSDSSTYSDFSAEAAEKEEPSPLDIFLRWRSQITTWRRQRPGGNLAPPPPPREDTQGHENN